MSFSFHEGLPAGLKSSFDLGIFHDPGHLNLQSAAGWQSFYIQHGANFEAVVHFYLDNQQAVSPCRSPFGSYVFSENVSEAMLDEFISYGEAQLSNLGVRYIVLKNQPERYAANKNQLLTKTLLKHGYRITKEETSAIIPVTGKSFESGLHKSEKKRLRKCRERALTFEVLPLDQLQELYTFLESCRKEKGYSLSMSFDEIKKLTETFSERILLTSVVDKSKRVAANVSIRVYNHVLYNFYHDHAAEYDQLSPVVLLNEGLYRFCQENKISLLDLGTSNAGDKLNESLLNFKLRLGAHPSRKLTFTKDLV